MAARRILPVRARRLGPALSRRPAPPSPPRLFPSSSHRLIGIAIVIVLALLVWRLASLFVLLFGAIVFSVALDAMADQVKRFTGLAHRWAMLAVVMLLLAFFTLVFWLMGDILGQQLSHIREQLPPAAEAVKGWLRSRPMASTLLDAWEDIKAAGVPWGRIAGFAGLTLNALASTLLVVVLGIYLATQPQLYQGGLVRLAPPAFRPRLAAALNSSARGLRSWLLGQLISMLFVGLSTGLGLWGLGIPLAATVGLISGLLGFVPFFGPIASGLFAVVLAFVQGPQAAFDVLILVVVIQQVEGQVLMPLVQRWTVALPPVLGIAAGVVFAVLFGITGLLFATPLMVVMMILVQKLYIEDYLERHWAETTLG